MEDVWTCSACRSINRRRDDRCYRCHERREAAMPTLGPDPRLTSAVANRAFRGYLPSWPLGLLAGGLILAVAVLGVIVLVREAAAYGTVRAAFMAALEGDPSTAERAVATALADATWVALLRGGLSLLALVTFAAWLALATLNVPALGGGLPSRGPVRVFVYTLIPLFNLVKVPAMIHEVLYRLDAEAGGFFLVLAAWMGLVGSQFVSWIGSWAITAAAVGRLVEARSLAEAESIFGALLDQTFALAVVVEVMVTAGAILLVVLMARIERRAALRDAEIRAAVPR